MLLDAFLGAGGVLERLRFHVRSTFPEDLLPDIPSSPSPAVRAKERQPQSKK